MFTTIVIDAFAAESDPKRYQAAYKATHGPGPLRAPRVGVGRTEGVGREAKVL